MAVIIAIRNAVKTTIENGTFSEAVTIEANQRPEVDTRQTGIKARVTAEEVGREFRNRDQWMFTVEVVVGIVRQTLTDSEMPVTVTEEILALFDGVLGNMPGGAAEVRLIESRPVLQDRKLAKSGIYSGGCVLVFETLITR